MGKPKLLFLCQNTPFPPDQGAKIRSYHLLRSLAEEYEVTLLCFSRENRPLPRTHSTYPGLGEITAFVEVFPIPQQGNRARFVWDHLRSIVSSRVYTVFAYESKALQSRIREFQSREKFDLVHMDSLDLSGYLPLFPDTPVVLGHHNVESNLLARRAEAETSPISRKYVRHQASLMAQEEGRCVPRVALNLACSPNDCEDLQGLSELATVINVPNGVDTRALLPLTTEGRGIMFLGGYDWFPNRDGMLFFAEEVLPLIRKQIPDLPVTWVGRVPDEVAPDLEQRYGFQVTGHVPDYRPWVEKSACLIVPLRVGGGTRLKILEGWSLGQAMVTTSLGCEGLDARDGENILVRDEATAFAEGILQAVSDSELRARLGAAGRRTVEASYDWKALGRSMLEEYRALLKEAQNT